MHCISDSSEANCSRCSLHSPGAFSAHTVRINSIIAHLSSSGAPRTNCGILIGRPQHWGSIGVVGAHVTMGS
jgi:hypothetical protein